MTTEALPYSTDTAAERRAEIWQVMVVSVAHFVSHYHMLVLPPLFLIVRQAFDVSYTELGAALVAYNVMTLLCQTPAGFMVDRFGARPILIGGLLLAAAAFAVAGLSAAFVLFLLMYAVAGIANAVYHPANFAILATEISGPRVSHAFSVHGFAGMLGGAAAPASILVVEAWFGWRGAFVVAAIFGVAAAMLIALPVPRPAAAVRAKPVTGAQEPAAIGWRFLLTPVILQNLFFYVLLAITSVGFQSYTVVALGALYGTPLSLANTALSACLLMTAFGVLAGGAVIARTKRYAAVAASCLLVFAALVALVGLVALPAAALVLTMGLAGWFSGLVGPSRDMIVRQATPPGAFGRVFGFVTSGFNIGGIIAPLIFGALMDHGSPQWVFYVTALCGLISVLTVMTIPKRAAA